MDRQQTPEATEFPVSSQACTEEHAGLLFSRRQLGIMAGGGIFLVAGAAGTVTLARTSIISRQRKTSFGTVEILRAARGPRLGPNSGAAHGASHGALYSGSNSLQPGNHTWGDLVLLELEVHNLSDIPVVLSPGQLRLRVGPRQVGVAPRDSDPARGLLAAGAVERLSVSFLTPSSAADLAAEFTGLWHKEAIALELPPLHNLSSSGGML